MITRETADSIAAILKVKPEDFWAKLSSEKDEAVELPTLKTFTDTEFNTRIENERSTAYSDGKTAGVEMEIKELKRKLGYDFEGKSVDKFMEHHDEQLKSKYSKDSSERVRELETDIQKLNETHSAQITTLQGQLTSLQADAQRHSITNQLLGIMPAETTIAKDDVITLFNSKHQVEVQDGKLVVKQNGAVIKDETTASPKELKDVFNSFIETSGFVKKSPGRGGGNEAGGSTAKTLTQFNENWIKQGKSLATAEYQQAYSKFRTENPDLTE